MTSGQFAPLLPIVAQVAGIDINKWKLLEDDLERYISLQNYDSDFVKQISDYIIVFICGYVIHGCRFQIYSQISHKSKAFVDIRFPIIN